MNGTLTGTGPLLNNTTGSFYGNGTILGNFTNSGTVRPGNSPGTLNITGNYTQTAGGVLEMEMASTSVYDRLNITGSANLNGTLRTVMLGSFVPSPGEHFNLLSAAGGISAASFIVDPYITPTLSWQAVITANGIGLSPLRDYTNIALGLNQNQNSVANVLNGFANTATGEFNTIMNAIDRHSASVSTADAMNQISAEKASALSTLAFAGSNLQKSVLSRRITDLRLNGEGTGLTGTLPGYLDITGSDPMRGFQAANYLDPSTYFRGDSVRLRPGVFFEPAVIVGSRDGTADQTGYDFTIAGFSMGADFTLRDDLLVGLATGYTHTDADFNGSGGGVEAHTIPITLYGAYMPKPFYAYGSLGYSLNLFDLDRRITFGGLDRHAKSSPDGHLFNAYGEVGYDFQVERAVLTPMASFAYSSLWIDGFSETGAGALNLDVFSRRAESIQAGLGGRLAVPFVYENFLWVPQLYATYQHEFSDSSTRIDARLAQIGPVFSFQPDGLGSDFVVIGADITLVARKDLKFRLDYNTEIGRATYTVHYLSGGLRYEF